MKTTLSPLKASALALALLAVSAGAHAAVIEIGDEASGHTQFDIAIGNDARAYGGVIGPGGGTGPAIAIGHGSRASAGDTVAIGAQARADSARSVAIGNYANTGPDAVALGHRAVAQQFGVAMGASSSAVAMGVAIGNGAETGNWYGTAIGSGASTTIDAMHGVALGSWSEATEAETVSVGNATLKRRVVNVGFGESAYDAVIFQQVVPALEGVVTGLGGGATYDPTTGVMTVPSYNLSVGSFDNVGDALVAIDGALGGGVAPQPNHYFKASGSGNSSDAAYAEPGEGAIAMGPRARAIGYQSVAAGAGSEAQGNEDIAIGSEAFANAGTDTAGAIAIGSRAVALDPGTIALGLNAEAQHGIAIGPQASASNDGVAVGGVAEAHGHVSAAFGYSAQAPGRASTAIGNNARANGDLSVALGAATSADAQCVALGVFSTCDEDRTVSVGGEHYGSRVVNLAPGINASDAVNVGQVAPIADALGGGANFNGGMFTGPVYDFRDNTSHVNVGSALDNLDARVYDLENADSGGGAPVPGPEGPQGPRGLDGRSAYEVAVDNGFDGSEQDWLESLHGRDGRDGIGGGSTVNAGTNIEVVDNDDNTQSVHLSDTVELTEQGSVSVGDTRVDAQGVHIQGGPSMTRNGVHAGNQRVTGVAPGRIEQGSTDAVNGGQLWEFERRMDDRWLDTNRNIERVGAQSAALSMMNGAATYLPVGKVSVNAGWGQYGSQSAFAVGAKARLSERSSLNIGFSFSGGKAMGGVGYSFIID